MTTSKTLKVRPFLTSPHLSVGADPEMFVFAGKKLIPAFAFLPKKSGNAQVYWDGFQAEWKYGDGAYCLDTFCVETFQRMKLLRQKARDFNKDAKLSMLNTVPIPEDYMKKAAPEHIALGCMPSFNANDIQGNVINDPFDLTDRFAGGHIHFGGFPTEPNHARIVKNLDMILGVWAVGAAEGMDTPRRRRYYGLAGEYRKPLYYKAKSHDYSNMYANYDRDNYGVEYRTLSNFWLCAPQITNITLEIGRTVAKIGRAKPEFDLWTAQPEETIHAIQACDVKLARQILKRNSYVFKAIWKSSRFSSSTSLRGTRLQKSADIVYNIGMNGVASVVKDPMDVENNWHLNKTYFNVESGRFRSVVDPSLLERDKRLLNARGSNY